MKPYPIQMLSTRLKNERSIGIIFFGANNYAVAKEVSVSKYCTKISWLGETQKSRYQRIMALPRRMFQNVSDSM